MNFFIISSFKNQNTNIKNTIFSTVYSPANQNQIEITISNQNNSLGWKHGLLSDTLYNPMPSIEYNKPYLWEFELNVDSLFEEIKCNGKKIAQKNNPNPINSNTQLYGNLGISNYSTSTSNYGDFNLGEIIFYDGNLNKYNKLKLQSYLCLKYGITLKDENDNTISMISAKDSVKIWNSTIANSYTHHVSGIGIDTINKLYQKQNCSVYENNKGNMLTIGFDTVTFSNADNPYIFGNDKFFSFYSWSDNNDSIIKTQISELPKFIKDSTCASRMPREWMMQRTLTDTNSIQSRNTFVKFNLNNTIDLSSKSIFSFKLMIDEDGDGNFNTGNIRLLSPNSYSNQILTFDSVYWDINKNGKDVFTLLFDYNIKKPKLTLKDTLYLGLNDSISVYDMITSIDTISYNYNIFDSSNNLINLNKKVTGNQWIKLEAIDKFSLCNTGMDSIYILNRMILKTWKTVDDSDKNGFVDINEKLKYKIFVINTDTISNLIIDTISIQDSIPIGTQYIIGSASNPGLYNNQIITYNYTNAQLKPKDTLVIIPNFEVRYTDTTFKVLEIKNTAHINYVDPSNGHNLKEYAGEFCKNEPCTFNPSTIKVKLNEANLGILKTSESQVVLIGSTVNYTIKIFNLGPSIAYNLIINDTIPSTLSTPTNISSSIPVVSFDSISNNLQWKIEKLLPNDTAILQYSCTIIKDEIIKNKASIISLNPDNDNTNNESINIINLNNLLIDENTIPNVITPNNDGFNDYFIIPGLENFKNSKLSIFNRWGSILYETDDYQNNWKGDELSEGTYFYILEIKSKNKTQVVKKWLQIIKINSK